MPSKRWLWILAGWGILANGCQRQDTDVFARIGHKLSHRLEETTAKIQEKLEHSFSLPSAKPDLESRVSARLRWEKTLADTAIEVLVHDKEVELKGQVQNADQRRRAVELAEATLGVEKVSDSLQVPEPIP